MERKVLYLKELMGRSDEMIDASGDDSPEIVREKLRACLKTEGKIVVSLKNITNLSPSYAYRAFANLFDSVKDLDQFDQKISFRDDERNLEDRVKAAIDRKRRVLQAEMSG